MKSLILQSGTNLSIQRLLCFRYVSALTGMVSIVLFMPCIFKEFSAKDIRNRQGGANNSDEGTAETLNIADAETTIKKVNLPSKTPLKGFEHFVEYFPSVHLSIFVLAPFLHIKLYCNKLSISQLKFNSMTYRTIS